MAMQDPVRLLSTLALKGVVQRLVGPYQAATGTRIDADFAPTLALLDRLRGHEPADLVILTRDGLDQVAADGLVAAETCLDLVRSHAGIAVTAGAARPDIATEAALRATLLAARSIAYSKIGASGILFAELIERMGISAAVNAKAIVVPSGLTAERLVSGEADLAVQQISELKQVAGIDVLGPIPLHLQTPAIFSAAVMAASPRRVEAERLLRHLASSDVVPAMREAGLEPCAL
jgi:molybdate transport system substrate-binding protein